MGDDKAVNFGPRLTGEEYDRRIVALHSGQPAAPSREADRATRRAELELAIDHRLGRAFPKVRREALWIVHQRVQGRPLQMMGRYLIKRLLGLSLVPEARGLAGYVIDEYAKVLSHEELEAFFGPEEVRSPGLPLDGTA